MSAWDYRRYGSAIDPIHKSHLKDLTGDYGCPTRFRYQRDERARVAATGGVAYNAETVRGDAATGTAVHETIARALTNVTTREAVLRGHPPSRSNVQRVFDEELEREISGRRVEWYDKDPDKIVAERIDMVVGVLDDLRTYVARIELVEPAFIARLGTYWLCGHIDLVYRPRSNPEAIAIADWKTGTTKPVDVELDHGWEAGVYTSALHSGYLLPRESIESTRLASGLWVASVGGMQIEHPSKYIAERECAERVLSLAACAVEANGDSAIAASLLTRYSRFPAEIYHVHLGDYVPYQKAGKKEAKRPEDLKFYGLAKAGPVKYERGHRRGPAWLPVRITEHDVPRVEYRMRNVVGMIRMGRFIDQVGEQCRRCPFASDCLNTGYAVRGEERKALERAMTAADVSAADELTID